MNMINGVELSDKYRAYSDTRLTDEIRSWQGVNLSDDHGLDHDGLLTFLAMLQAHAALGISLKDNPLPKLHDVRVHLARVRLAEEDADRLAIEGLPTYASSMQAGALMRVAAGGLHEDALQASGLGADAMTVPANLAAINAADNAVEDLSDDGEAEEDGEAGEEGEDAVAAEASAGTPPSSLPRRVGPTVIRSKN